MDKKNSVEERKNEDDINPGGKDHRQTFPGTAILRVLHVLQKEMKIFTIAKLV